MNRDPAAIQFFRERIRSKHYSVRTRDAYVQWARRFLAFHADTPVEALDESDLDAFIEHIEATRRVAPSTRSQACSAVLCLLRELDAWSEHSKALPPLAVAVR